MDIVLATHNNDKVTEFQTYLNPFGVSLISAKSLDVPEPEETGRTFQENAILKAINTFDHTGKPALADDSGLSVKAIGGQPGIYSARWAGPDKDFGMAMRKVKDMMGNCENKSASFICVLAYAVSSSRVFTYEGRVKGRIVWPPRGDKGFGYDPFFVPDEGDGRSFGEMTLEEKGKFSHRALAIRQFCDDIFSQKKDYG